MKNEERVTLEMSMEDYGYVVNTLKSMQINLAGTDIATTRMSIGIAGSLNILERSQVVLDIWGNIDRAMVKGYVNTLNEAANDIARGKATQQTVMDIKDVASSIYKHLPEEDETDDVLDDHEDRISELYEEVNNIKDLFKSYDNADKALHRRLQFVEDRLDRISDYEKHLTAISNKTDKVYEQNEANDSRITDLHIKIDNKIDILEEKMKNTMKTVDDVKTAIENLWGVVTGTDDSLDERVETLSHRVDILENRAKPNISCADDILKEAANKFDISSASFNLYFENNKKKEDDDDD